MKDPSTPHVKIASLTLPPDVQGEVRGELVVCVELVWNYRKPPQQVQLRVRWWGATADTVVPFHATRGAGAAFPLTSGPRYLARYLKDMGCAVLTVEECPSGRPVGSITVDVSGLDVSKPVEANVPLKGSNGQVLASAAVSMRVHYSALLSSFELNEHLATTDRQLPLYPVPAVQHQQQPGAAAGKAAAAGSRASTGKENAGQQLPQSNSANHLPDKEQLQAGGHPLPDSRFMRYCFPGEEPLFTQEVGLVPSPVFSAHAQHTVLLPPGQALADCLADDSSAPAEEQQQLGFELQAAQLGCAGVAGARAQTFCPQFHHRQVVPLTLAGPTLAALASADCAVELWHHCPRSQAVAAALSRGQSSSYAMAGQQQVLLGSGGCSLQALLTRPHGIRSWVVLKSQLGQAVGAVQVALQFTHIGGTPHDTCPAADCAPVESRTHSKAPSSQQPSACWHAAGQSAGSTAGSTGPQQTGASHAHCRPTRCCCQSPSTSRAGAAAAAAEVAHQVVQLWRRCLLALQRLAGMPVRLLHVARDRHQHQHPAGAGILRAVGPVLVWLRPLPAAAAAGLPPLYAGAAAVPCPATDQRLGCAALDMAALHVLGSIEGWYNVDDARGPPRGQIKRHSSKVLGKNCTRDACWFPNLTSSLRRSTWRSMHAFTGPYGQLAGMHGTPGNCFCQGSYGDVCCVDQVADMFQERFVSTALCKWCCLCRAISQELDAISAALTERVKSSSPVRFQGDDEEFTTGVGGITDSDTDTEELMGQVDWSMAQNSDDEWPSGPAGPSRQLHTQCSSSRGHSSNRPCIHKAGPYVAVKASDRYVWYQGKQQHTRGAHLQLQQGGWARNQKMLPGAAKLAAHKPAAAGHLLGRLVSIWHPALPTARTWQMASVLWASSKLKFKDAQLWRVTLEAFMQQLQEPGAVVCLDVSNAMYSMGTIASVNKGVVPGLSKDDVTAAVGQLCSQMQVITSAPQLDGAIANALWATSDLQQRCRWQPTLRQQTWQLLLSEQQLLKAANDGSRIASGASITQAAQACATLQFKDEQLLSAMLQWCKRQLAQLQRSGKCAGEMRAEPASVVLATASWVCWAVVNLEVKAVEVKAVVAGSWGKPQELKLRPSDASRLWEVHSWLVGKQLLDAQGLAGLLRLVLCVKPKRCAVLRVRLERHGYLHGVGAPRPAAMKLRCLTKVWYDVMVTMNFNRALGQKGLG
ncbi:hypothetical protein COO60DRAFT_1627040 [Scenedesmus sp. NREL 46B-D3]|nr:hypothetical protein COO60DRAFT_1627040 [Scenedesmus sp. NREL 46B-D3]